MRSIGQYLLSMAAVLVFSVTAAYASSAGQPDSLKLAALDAKLDEYIMAISRESLEVQKQECDFIIESAADPVVRNRIANKVYTAYLESPLMGAEAVAIHIFDKWFLSGNASMGSDLAFLNARIHADFNRQSLLGCKAPELRMRNRNDGWEDVLPQTSGRYAVLYFYDADCAKCKVQSILLRNLLDVEDYPVDLYAVYTGDDRSEWEQYVSERLEFDSGVVTVKHLWDPEIDSDYQRKYGVIQTPRMFLIAPDGMILGRGLDAKALSQMLEAVFSEKLLNYGGQESEALYDMVFGENEHEVSKKDVEAVADHIYASTLEKGDTVMFRQMTGDLLYYLSARRGEAFKEGMGYLIDNHILGQGKVWKSQDDSLKVVGMALIMDDLLSKAVPGSRLTDIKVPGTILSVRGEKEAVKPLKRIGGKKNFIMFLAEGCNICAAEKKALQKLVSGDRRVKGFLVNVDELMEVHPELASSLFDLFDLTSLPFIIESDAKGRVVRRYVSF